MDRGIFTVAIANLATTKTTLICHNLTPQALVGLFTEHLVNASVPGLISRQPQRYFDAFFLIN